MAVTVTQKIAPKTVAGNDTTSITVDVGTNVGLLAFTLSPSGAAVHPFVTFNSRPFIKLNQVSSSAVGGSDQTVEAFYLPNAPVGTANFVLTSGGADYCVVQITEGKMADPSAGVAGAGTANSATGPDLDITISAAAIIFSFVSSTDTGTASANSGWTIGNSGTVLTDGSNHIAYAYREYTAATTSTGAEVLFSTAGGTTDWIAVSVAIKTSTLSPFSRDKRVVANSFIRNRKIRFNG